MTCLEHRNTFLRSAIVKDPFCFGDLGPEDVLRIESEFPNLFSTSPPPQQQRKLQERKTQFPAKASPSKASKVSSKSTGKKQELLKKSPHLQSKVNIHTNWSQATRSFPFSISNSQGPLKGVVAASATSNKKPPLPAKKSATKSVAFGTSVAPKGTSLSKDFPNRFTNRFEQKNPSLHSILEKETEALRIKQLEVSKRLSAPVKRTPYDFEDSFFIEPMRHEVSRKSSAPVKKILHDFGDSKLVTKPDSKYDISKRPLVHSQR